MLNFITFTRSSQLFLSLSICFNITHIYSSEQKRFETGISTSERQTRPNRARSLSPRTLEKTKIGYRSTSPSRNFPDNDFIKDKTLNKSSLEGLLSGTKKNDISNLFTATHIRKPENTLYRYESPTLGSIEQINSTDKGFLFSDYIYNFPPNNTQVFPYVIFDELNHFQHYFLIVSSNFPPLLSKNNNVFLETIKKIINKKILRLINGGAPIQFDASPNFLMLSDYNYANPTHLPSTSDQKISLTITHLLDKTYDNKEDDTKISEHICESNNTIYTYESATLFNRDNLTSTNKGILLNDYIEQLPISNISIYPYVVLGEKNDIKHYFWIIHSDHFPPLSPENKKNLNKIRDLLISLIFLETIQCTPKKFDRKLAFSFVAPSEEDNTETIIRSSSEGLKKKKGISIFVPGQAPQQPASAPSSARDISNERSNSDKTSILLPHIKPPASSAGSSPRRRTLNFRRGSLNHKKEPQMSNSEKEKEKTVSIISTYEDDTSHEQEKETPTFIYSSPTSQDMEEIIINISFPQKFMSEIKIHVELPASSTPQKICFSLTPRQEETKESIYASSRTSEN